MKVFINYLLNIFKKNFISIIFLIFIICVIYIKVPYTVYCPGGTINIEERLSNPVYKSKGSINLTYVSTLDGNLVTYLLGLILPNWDLVKNEDRLMIDEDMEELTLRETISLYESISNATYNAYSAAGIDVNITSKNFYVYYILKERAETTLKIGDRIISYDGVNYDVQTNLLEYISKKNVGDKINFKVDRFGKNVDTYAVVKEIEGRKIIGIVIDTIFNYDNKPDVKYSYHESEIGSSGGLMLSLSIYNALVEKDITKGRKISGTGTIDLDGNVGPIGGVTYKIKGAVDGKSDIFIVPSENYKESKDYIKKKKYKIKLIKAENFKQVLDSLDK